MRTLLIQFHECRARADAVELVEQAGNRENIRILLVGYDEAVKHHRQAQEELADDFNLLDVMRLTGKEIRHSMVLAWLLDHDLSKLGTHAQGNLGFRLFLEEFSLPLHYADCMYGVRREVAGDESIVDVEIACRDHFVIHIENKIWSSEGNDQSDREWSDLQHRATELKVRLVAVHALFLTPRGTKPKNAGFRAIRWGRIVSVLEKFAEMAKPADVKLFTAHYARALRRFIAVDDIRESQNAETADERS
jgi:hypothetical protein